MLERKHLFVTLDTVVKYHPTVRCPDINVQIGFVRFSLIVFFVYYKLKSTFLNPILATTDFKKKEGSINVCHQTFQLNQTTHWNSEVQYIAMFQQVLKPFHPENLLLYEPTTLLTLN